MPAPSGSDEITGETRYRTGWFGKLILQVEEVYRVGIYGRPIAGGIELVQRTIFGGRDHTTILHYLRKRGQT